MSSAVIDKGIEALGLHKSFDAFGYNHRAKPGSAMERSGIALALRPHLL